MFLILDVLKSLKMIQSATKNALVILLFCFYSIGEKQQKINLNLSNKQFDQQN
jgi:hypothetical protein